MVRLRLACLLLACAVSATCRADAFSHVDRDANGELSRSELERASPPPGGGWIAGDRNGDGRYGRGEFEALEPGAGTSGSGWTPRSLKGGISARRLIGAPARDLYGASAGSIRDLVIDRDGRASLLVGGRPLPWRDALIRGRTDYVEVAPESAGAGGTAPTPPSGEWRASRFLGGRAQIRPGQLYAEVRDLILSPQGEVLAVVVDRGPRGEKGQYAYPWRGRDRLSALQPFDYASLGIDAPS
jgi:hypothetical protein